MSNVKKIKWQINSVSNLQKITKALEIVSTVKLQKTKQNTENYRDFMFDFLSLLNVVSSRINIFEKKEVQSTKRLLIVTSSDKGLCWALNNKLFRHIFSKYHYRRDQNDIFCIGKKAFEFFVRSGFNVVGYIENKDDIAEVELSRVNKYLRDSLKQGKYEKIKIYFNYFKNTITQIPLRFKIFPLNQESFDKYIENLGIKLDDVNIQDIDHKDLLVEPTIKKFSEELVTQLIEHMIYSAVLQNKTWEFSARMLAMKNAKDNSDEIIKKLKLWFNKARQWIITQEVSEIMSAKMAIEEA